MTLAHTAARIDPMTDVALARRLADSAGSEESGIPAADVGRVMEILAEISEGSRILPSLMRLLRHTNPFVRSKAVKLVGCRCGSVKWMRRRLAESDPRIRANAIEALWGVDNEEARELLRMAANDSNNRVAGNALIALYRLGDCSVIPAMLKLAEHSSALFRATAAWAMGEACDPRFTEALARLLREPNAAVRTRAMSALGQIKAAVARLRSTPRCLATGLWLEFDPQKPARRLQLAVTSADGGEHHTILATQFLLTEEGKHVLNYKVTERPAPEAMSVVFVCPRSGIPGDSPWTLGALHCLEWKRPSDLWAVQTYLLEESPGGEVHSDDSAQDGPHYSAKRESIAAALSATTRRSDCVPLWKSIWQAVRRGQSQARGRRHLILYCDQEPEQAAGVGLISAVLASRGTIQIISAGPNPRLEEFCRKARAGYQIAGTREEAVEAISLAYLNLLARYEITYQSVFPEGRTLKIRVNGGAGWAETSLAIPDS